jgi:beta-phosphoglucomutase
MMSELVNIPNIGSISTDSGFKILKQNADGMFKTGENGVVSVCTTGDEKVEFISFADRSLAYVKSEMGYPAYYPIHPTRLKGPVKAVLMDLDGTTIRSEGFWIWIIEKTTQSLLDDASFRLEEGDPPFVSGHSVSEHLQYCIAKYNPGASLEDARKYYFQHTHFEMNEIMEGRGKPNAFTPSPGIKVFLLKLKEMGIKIGLVTSGLYEKAWPEILDGFKTLGLGDPKNFYDCIITAGFPLRRGEVGTLGELSPKPHPWLYAEVARVGLGLNFADRNSIVGIEDSGAGICAIRLAGYPTIGMADGNIISSGTLALCDYYCEDFEEVYKIIANA